MGSQVCAAALIGFTTITIWLICHPWNLPNTLCRDEHSQEDLNLGKRERGLVEPKGLEAKKHDNKKQSQEDLKLMCS